MMSKVGSEEDKTEAWSMLIEKENITKERTEGKVQKWNIEMA